MDKNNIGQTAQALFQGLDSIISTKSVVGEPQVIGDTTLIPLVDVSFGMGAGSTGGDRSGSGAGGVGGKITPNAILVIRNDEIRVIHVHSQDALDTIAKAVDMVPHTVNTIVSLVSNRGKNEPAVDKALEKADIDGTPVRRELTLENDQEK